MNAALQRLSPQFDKIYAPGGRDSIAPERLLRALLLQALFSVRSERQLMEQITYNMMFRWFVGLSMDAPVWDVTLFTKNRERLLQGDIARGFLAAILVDPPVKPLMSDEHFSIDDTLIEAWASMKSFRPRDGSGEPPAPGGRYQKGPVTSDDQPRSRRRLVRPQQSKEITAIPARLEQLVLKNGIVTLACDGVPNGERADNP